MKNNPMKWLFALILVLIVAYVTANMTAGNQKLQRPASVSLNEYVDSGAEFPAHEYVSCEARWVLGPFATNTEYTTFNITQITNRVDNYYYLILEDMTVMALCASDKTTVARLDAMSEWLGGEQGFPMTGETFTVRGELRNLTASELRTYFDDGAKSIFGLDPNDPAIRYVILDTNTGTEHIVAIVAVALVLIIAAAALISARKKRSLQSRP